MRHHYLNIAALCVVALTVTLGYPNHLWAQKGVGDLTLARGERLSKFQGLLHRIRYAAN
jgi:hypothetical protein